METNITRKQIEFLFQALIATHPEDIVRFGVNGLDGDVKLMTDIAVEAIRFQQELKNEHYISPFDGNLK